MCRGSMAGCERRGRVVESSRAIGPSAYQGEVGRDYRVVVGLRVETSVPVWRSHDVV